MQWCTYFISFNFFYLYFRTLSRHKILAFPSWCWNWRLLRNCWGDYPSSSGAYFMHHVSRIFVKISPWKYLHLHLFIAFWYLWYRVGEMMWEGVGRGLNIKGTIPAFAWSNWGKVLGKHQSGFESTWILSLKSVGTLYLKSGWLKSILRYQIVIQRSRVIRW